MSQRDKNTPETLDIHSLEHVTGGLSLALLPATLANHRQQTPYGTPGQFGDSLLSGFGAHTPFGSPSHYGAPAGIGGNLTHLSASVAYNVNAMHGQVTATSETYNAARAIAQQTNGAIVFGGDLNNDGRIGAEDFLRSNRISEGRAAQAVGQILDRVEAVGYQNAGSGGFLQQLPLGQILPVVGQIANWIFRSDGHDSPRPAVTRPAGTTPVPPFGTPNVFNAAPPAAYTPTSTPDGLVPSEVVTAGELATNPIMTKGPLGQPYVPTKGPVGDLEPYGPPSPYTPPPGDYVTSPEPYGPPMPTPGSDFVTNQINESLGEVPYPPEPPVFDGGDLGAPPLEEPGGYPMPGSFDFV